VAETGSTKAPDAFRTISEVAEELDLPQHVLRFWETRFAQIKPMKRGGGRRYYRPEDVNLLRGIRLLLYSEGFTIRGVQRLLKEKGLAFVVAVGQTGSVQTVTAADRDEPPAARRAPRELLAEEAEVEEAVAETAEAEEPMAAPSLPPMPAPAASGLSREGRRKIEAALSELLEAKRLLDQVR
jgi:DNA-binding transcriptional MerR regulator